MSQPRRSAAIIFDLEFTSWEGSVARNWAQPNEKKEIVQIGAVKLGAQDLKILDSFEILVRPRFNAVLSDYFIQLTGITNDALAARAVDFITAYRSFLDFVGDAPLWAFGRDDSVLLDNLRLYGWEQDHPLPNYRNVIPWFAEQGVDLAGKHACDVAGSVGVAFEGHKHDALADAHGVAAGIVKCCEGGAPNPFSQSDLMPPKRGANMLGKTGKSKK